MSTVFRWALVLAGGLSLTGGAALLLYTGVYGLTLFAATPVLVGALTVLVLQPQTADEVVVQAVLAIVILSVALLLIKIEGLICILMALPLALPLSMLGGGLMFCAIRRNSAKHNLTAMAMLPVATLLSM